MGRRFIVRSGILGTLICVAIVAFVTWASRGAGWANSNASQSPLFKADTAPAAEAAIAKGADVNETDRYGRTPLHRAAGFGLTEVVAVLLKHNANVHAAKDDGATPLHLAVGEFPDPDEGLQSSAYETNKSVLLTARLLVQNGADVNSRNAQGETPLFTAVRGRENLDVVIFLLDSGATVRLATKDLETPLYQAVHAGCSAEMVRRLLSAGADPNVQEKWFGETPLHVAAQNGDFEIVRLLLANGAKPILRDRNGKTAADRTQNPTIRALFVGTPSP